MAIQIIADSCCDVTGAMKNLLKVDIASLTIQVGEKQFVDDETLDTSVLIADMKAYKGPPRPAPRRRRTPR